EGDDVRRCRHPFRNGDDRLERAHRLGLHPGIGAGYDDITAGGGIELALVLPGGEDPGEGGGNEDAGNEEDERTRKPPGAEGHAVRQTRRTGCTLPQAIDSSMPKLMVPHAVVCACRAASDSV